MGIPLLDGPHPSIWLAYYLGTEARRHMGDAEVNEPKLLYLVIDRKPDDPTKRAVFLSTHWDEREAVKASWQAGWDAGEPARFTVSAVELPR